jgi:CTP synthase (UTP-ammonia lyase)
VLRRLGMPVHEPDLSEWRKLVADVKTLRERGSVKIALVGQMLNCTTPIFP